MTTRRRIDLALGELYPAYSRQQIQSFIMQGKVRVNGELVTKPGMMITSDAYIELEHTEPRFVSRAGYKLEAALDVFGINVTGLVALDAGISTGGFTDCLLQRGARKVYGIDVGYGQVAEKIRNDPRVVLYERTNLRNLRDVGELVDVVTLDLSFISVLKVMDAVQAVLKPNGALVVLIKPQFEAGRDEVGKGGIVKDPAVHEAVITHITDEIQKLGFTLKGVISSPILGAEGNKEFLAYFVRG